MKRVAIYGAGDQGRIFFDAIRKDGVGVNLFIDQFTSIKELFGVPVLRLSDVQKKESTIVYISIAMDDRSGTDLVATLRSEGFVEVIDFVSAMGRHPAILSKFFYESALWMRPDPSEMINAKELERVEALLSDEDSRSCLRLLIRFRETMSPEHYPVPDGQNEYFPSDIDLFSGIDRLRFADCGAYRGDTVLDVLGLGRPVEYIASFEPDPANLAKLEHAIGHVAPKNPDIRFFVFNMGVWSRPDLLRFNCNSGSSSSIHMGAGEEGRDTMSIPVTSLDIALYGAAPNFIKMDIEGAEGEALKGCRQIIERYNPVMAVCVYHKPRDLWELPLFIQDNYPGYRMYLRLHSHLGTSTVLYCVPP